MEDRVLGRWRIRLIFSGAEQGKATSLNGFFGWKLVTIFWRPFALILVTLSGNSPAVGESNGDSGEGSKNLGLFSKFEIQSCKFKSDFKNVHFGR